MARKPKPSADNDASIYLKYKRHISEKIVLVGSHSLMTCFELRGLAYETVDKEQLATFRDQISRAWVNIGDERLAVWTHLVRNRAFKYPEGKFWTAYARDLDQKYQEKMSAEQLYENRLFVSLVWNPNISSAAKIGSFFSGIANAKKNGVEYDPDAIKAIEEKSRDFVQLFDKYQVRQLGMYEKNGVVFSEISEFLQLIATCKPSPVPVVNGQLWGSILIDRPFFGREGVELRGAGTSRYAAALGVKDWSASAPPAMLHEILNAPFELVLSQSFVFHSIADSRKIFSLKQKQLINTEDRAASQIDLLDNALSFLEDKRFVTGEAHLNLFVYADSSAELLDVASKARRLLINSGLNIAREDLALEDAYWGQFPANTGNRARSATLTSLNFASLSGFQNPPNGEKKSHWGEAVAMLKTSAQTPFYFNFHYEDLGSTIIIGKSGSGKTVLQNFLLAQAQKLDPTIVFFDKDNGAELFVRAAGGTYLTLQNGIPTGCAPLKALNFDDPTDFAFLEVWVSKLVERPDRPLSVEDQKNIQFGLQGLAPLPPNMRTLTELRNFFPQKDTEGIGARLERWCKGGSLAWAFDGDDELRMDARFMGFDMTTFLDNPELRTPLMMYLFHRVEKLIDGRRIIIDIDEFWKALADPYFQEVIKNKLKTIRKQNGILIFGTQEPDDAINSAIGSTILSQVGTIILTPNDGAKVKGYVEGLGVSHKVFDLIRNQLTPEMRQFIIKQGNNAVVAELNLKGFDDEMVILSGRTDAINKCRELRQKYGDAPDAWLPKLIESQRRK